jgi:hypothetical protein
MNKEQIEQSFTYYSTECSIQAIPVYVAKLFQKLSIENHQRNKLEIPILQGMVYPTNGKFQKDKSLFGRIIFEYYQSDETFFNISKNLTMFVGKLKGSSREIKFQDDKEVKFQKVIKINEEVMYLDFLIALTENSVYVYYKGNYVD